MILSKKQAREEEKPDSIYWNCGYGQLDSSSHFLKGKPGSQNPEKPNSQYMSGPSKELFFPLKSRSRKSKISLKPNKEKQSVKIKEGGKNQCREEGIIKFHNFFYTSYPQESFSSKRIAYTIPNMDNGRADGKQSDVFIRVTSSSKMSLKQPALVNNFSSFLQKEVPQLTFDDDRKLVGPGLVVARQESREERQKTKRSNDQGGSLLSCSLNLDSLKDEYHLDESRFNSYSNLRLNDGRCKGLLSPVKSLTSLKDMIETESISDDEKSEECKESVVVGRLSHKQFPAFKTLSREETAAASLTMNKIFKSQANI